MGFSNQSLIGGLSLETKWQLSSTLRSFSTEFNTSVVWAISIFWFIVSLVSFPSSWGLFQGIQNTIAIIVNFMSYKLFLLVFRFTFFFFFKHCDLLKWRGPLVYTFLIWFSYIKIPENFIIIFSRTEFDVCMYHLTLWSNFSRWHNSLTITFPAHSCLQLYFFNSNAANWLTWFTVSSLTSCLYLLFSWVL